MEVKRLKLYLGEITVAVSLARECVTITFVRRDRESLKIA